MPVVLVEQLEDSDAAGNLTQSMHAQFTVGEHPGTFDATVPLTSSWKDALIAEIEARVAEVSAVYGATT